MKIEFCEDYGIILKEVFNGVSFETEEGETLTVCMRDSGFEIGIIKKPKDIRGGRFVKRFSIQKGEIKALNPTKKSLKF